MRREKERRPGRRKENEVNSDHVLGPIDFLSG